MSQIDKIIADAAFFKSLTVDRLVVGTAENLIVNGALTERDGSQIVGFSAFNQRTDWPGGGVQIDGAKVSATLIETRKGEKVKIFKKIRRQGYRRTRGHRQSETVLRVTSIAGAGKTSADTFRPERLCV